MAVLFSKAVYVDGQEFDTTELLVGGQPVIEVKLNGEVVTEIPNLQIPYPDEENENILYDEQVIDCIKSHYESR